jgi:hypothetical protein
VLLLIPAVGMVISREWRWGFADFLLAGAMVFGTGLAFELLARRGRSAAYRAASALALGALLLILWASLAVGIIGDGSHPANLLYVGVVAVAVVGPSLARFRAGEMAIAMLVTALVQAVVMVIVMAVGFEGVGGVELVANGVVLVMFVTAAVLYRKAR